MMTSAASSRVMLVEDTTRAPRPPGAPRLRRYRLARIQVNPPRGLPSGRERFAHLRRLYD